MVSISPALAPERQLAKILLEAPLLKGRADSGVAGFGTSSHKKGLGTANSNHREPLLTLSQLLSELIWFSQPSYPCYNFTGEEGKSLA